MNTEMKELNLEDMEQVNGGDAPIKTNDGIKTFIKIIKTISDWFD